MAMTVGMKAFLLDLVKRCVYLIGIGIAIHPLSNSLALVLPIFHSPRQIASPVRGDACQTEGEGCGCRELNRASCRWSLPDPWFNLQHPAR